MNTRYNAASSTEHRICACFCICPAGLYKQMIGYRASQLSSREIEIGTERDRSISIHGFNTATTAVQVSYPRGSLNTTQVRLHQCLKKQPKNRTFLCQPHHRKRKEEGPWNSALQPVWDLPTEWRYLTSDVGKKSHCSHNPILIMSSLHMF